MDFYKIYKENGVESVKDNPHPFFKEYYSKIFDNRNKINLLEIGIREGISLGIHSKYFHNGLIVGVDVNDFNINEMTNVKKYVEDAYTKKFCSKLKNKEFDFIIEDGSHELEHQKFTINNFIPKLKIGGKIIIEDVGCKDGTKTIISPDECIKELEEVIKTHDNVSYKVFDFRDKGIYYSIIIEITRLN